MHGGEIGCQSKPRRGDDLTSGGSEFFFSIAYDEAAAQEYQSQKHRNKDDAPTATTDLNDLKPSSGSVLATSVSGSSLTSLPSEATSMLGNIQMVEGMFVCLFVKLSIMFIL